MMRRFFTRAAGTGLAFATLALVCPATSLRGQTTAPPEVLAYPETVLYNGKIVTMDDASRTPNLGTTVQAMAVRGQEILKLGTDADLLRLAGPNTRRIDLQGRTVIPGLVDTHSHLHDMSDHWGGTAPSVPVPGQTPEEVARNLETILKKAVQETPPGNWIRLSLAFPAGNELVVQQKKFTRRDLDRLAPNHPVHAAVRTIALVNGKAIEAVENFYRSKLVDDALDRETGIAFFGTEFNRAIPVMLLHDRPDVLAENVRKELEEWASFGVTTFSSHINVPDHVSAYAELNRRGIMPIRFAWTHRSGTIFNGDAASFYLRIGDLAGSGSDYWWNIGVTVGHLDQTYPGIATSIDAKPEIKEREIDLGSDGHFKHDVMFDMVRAGLRITGTHIAGDRALDNFLDILEQGSQAAGLTLAQVRAKEHVIDHCALGPRPEQYERIKRLNVIMSCAPKYIASVAPYVLKDYGEKYLDWVVPMKTMIASGVRTVWEEDEHPEASAFEYLALGITRKGKDGRVWAPSQKLDRAIALKAATIWASEYVLRPKQIGTLEAGKWADFLVLNQDYFTVPEDQIGKVRPWMTVVGGKIAYLNADYAKELGMQPIGFQPKAAR